LVVVLIAGVALPSSALALPPGTLDPSFASGGTLVHQFGSANMAGAWSEGFAVAVQSDGKVVIGGMATDSSGNNEALVVRLNPDGSLDGSFGNGGVVTQQLSVGAGSSIVRSLAIQSDGKIVIAGQATDAGHTAVMVARLNPDGTFDSSFNSTGVLVSQQGSPSITSPSSEADSLILQGSKIVIGGRARDSNKNEQFMVLRLNSDGSFDSSFGSGGAVIQQLAAGTRSAVTSLALQSDGKIIAGGDTFDGSQEDFMVARLNGSDGSFDSTFGSGGTVIRQLASTAMNPDSLVDAVGVQPDGKIVAGGSLTDPNRNSEVMLARLNPDGSFDNSFGSSGVVSMQLGAATATVPSPSSFVSALVIQPNGKTVAGVWADSDTSAVEVARFNGDGSLDASFGTGGIVATAPGAGINSDQDAVALQPDGKILDSGEVSASNTPSTAQFFVARVIGDPPPPTPTAGVLELTGVSQSHRRWREGSAPPHTASAKRPPVGTTFRFTVNQSATVRFSFTQKLAGRKVGHRCVAPSKKNRHNPKCARTVTRGALSFSVAAGPHKLRFDGRLSKHKKLPLGRYTLIITATSGSGPPATKRLTFTIVKA
jgi:uncharacterized delta-60 repeat protein